MSLPPSSPRLPSPPPPTEIQIGPKSPSRGGPSSQETTIEQSIIDANARRRIRPGTKAGDMAAGPPLIPLNELDSAFQLQEHLKALHYHYSKPMNSDKASTIPISRDTAHLIATQPEGVDRALWLYELCRLLINKCNDLIVGFLFDNPPCSASTCPEMRASEWQFLCAVHESPKSCCAIDYCCHTLDWATNIVTSQKIFPSRLSLGAGDAVDERGAGVKHLTNIFRRLHRIFAHAWFQHRDVFWHVEMETGLYVLFKTVCDTYDLLPAENYKLPPEAEGLEPAEEARAAVTSIMKPGGHANNLSVEEDFINVGRTNTRRHIRQSPSVGSAVTTVLESDEEEADVTQKLKDLEIAEEDEGETDIPVIVETYEDETRETEPDEAQAEVKVIEDEETKSADRGESDSVDQPSSDTNSAPSSTSSWDSMSSEFLGEKERAKESEEEVSKNEEPSTDKQEQAAEELQIPRTMVADEALESAHEKASKKVVKSVDEENETEKA